MSRLTRALGVAALALLALLGGAAPASAAGITAAAATPNQETATRPILLGSVEDFTIDSFDADYTLGRDDSGRSTLRTVERIVAHFPDFDQNRGLIRDIPRVFDEHSTSLEVVSVTDETGAPRPFTTGENGDFLSVTVAVPEGSYVHGAQTYVIEYTQRDVTRLYDDTGADEFYWDVNGTGWQQPFGRVTARLTLTGDLADALSGSTACYRGYMGSGDRCELTGDGGSFATAQEALNPYENVTIAVGFAPHTFSAPPVPLLKRVPLLLYAGIASFLAGIVLTVVLRIRNRGGARTGRAIIAQYEPTAGVSAAVSAEMLGAQKQAMTATLLDLAVRRRIRLLHDEESDQYGARPVDGSGLLPLDDRVYRKLFSDSAPDALGSEDPDRAVWFRPSSTRLGDAAAELRRSAEREVLELGLKRKPSRRLFALIPVLFLVGLGLAVLHAWVQGSVGGVIAIFVVGVNVLVWLSLGAMAFAASGNPRTREGAQLHDHLMGLREYIRLAEADRIRMLQSASGAEVGADRIVQVYELLLPYAVLFGYEREWQGELARYYGESGPEWVGGSAGFAHGMQLGAFQSFVAASPVTRTESSSSFGSGSGSGSSFSSSSGGSSGGGFSGGGGGGGGGGGI